MAGQAWRADAGGPTGVNLSWYDDSNISVACPWNPLFVTEARVLRGKWNPDRRMWIFPRDETPQIRALLDEIFYADGSPAPGIDILLDLNQFLPDGLLVPALEIAGRRIVSIRPDRSGCQIDHQASLIHGAIFPEGEGLGWSSEAFIEVRYLPEEYLSHLPADQRSAVWVLARHGLDLDELRRHELAAAVRLSELRLAIEHEELADPGLAPTSLEHAPSGPAWRLRCRPNPDGGRQVIVHLDGCMSTQSTRTLTTEEVLDLAARDARLCSTCGAYRTARALGAPTMPGSRRASFSAPGRGRA
ncbi:hypothetical protein OG786_13795 [Streptomyces sp. NBC_00101]|uniref:DUF6233 domain-containing protein n=1 Tax=Streptomyces sp. NBC_00101 TaxID=2975651 RepID=UPI00324B11FD